MPQCITLPITPACSCWALPGKSAITPTPLLILQQCLCQDRRDRRLRSEVFVSILLTNMPSLIWQVLLSCCHLSGQPPAVSCKHSSLRLQLHHRSLLASTYCRAGARVAFQTPCQASKQQTPDTARPPCLELTPASFPAVWPCIGLSSVSIC